MQAVILAAGKGTRMGELTKNTPKPMLQVAGSPFLEYIFDRLPKEIDEVILVVGYLKEQIQNHFGDEWNGRKVSYVVQEDLRGTGPALWTAKDLLKGKFLVLMADDLYPTKDLEECLKFDWSLLVLEEEEIQRGGKVALNTEGKLLDVVESNDHGGGKWFRNSAVYVLGPEIFKYELVKVQDKNELGLPQTIVVAGKDFPVSIVKASPSRILISTPEDLGIAEKIISQSN